MTLQKTLSLSTLCLVLSAMSFSVATAQDLDPAVKTKLDAKLESIKAWTSDPVVIAAVEAVNKDGHPDAKDMNQDKWKALGALDAFVKKLAQNDAAKLLKGKKDPAVSELFVNAANGTKVALFAKTSSWSHEKSAKHSDPMTGKTWYGKVEVDESSLTKQIQVGLPISKDGKVIGSMVIGFDIGKL